jgi:hypothetical protein
VGASLILDCTGAGPAAGCAGLKHFHFWFIQSNRSRPPNFLFAAKENRVCGFQPPESRMKFVDPTPALQEIRVVAFPQEKPHFAELDCAE